MQLTIILLIIIVIISLIAYNNYKKRFVFSTVFLSKYKEFYIGRKVLHNEEESKILDIEFTFSPYTQDIQVALIIELLIEDKIEGVAVMPYEIKLLL